MDVWVDLKLNQHFSIQHVIFYGIGSHKSVLFCFSAYGMSLVLKRGTTIFIANSYDSLLTHFFRDKVYIDSGIINILSEKPLIKFHPKIITRDQSISNVTGQKSDKSIPEMSQLPLTFRFHHTFSTNYNWCQFLFVNKNTVRKCGEVWFYVDPVAVKK